MKKIILILNIYFILNSVNTNPVKKFHLDTEETLLDQYITDIKSQLDTTINPCKDFAQYACGNLKNQDRIGYRFHNKDSFVMEDNLLKDRPITDAEQRAKDFYLSCRDENDLKKIFDQVDILKKIFYDNEHPWPMNAQYSKQRISELMAELASIVEMDMIKIQFKDNQIFLEGAQPKGIENINNVIKTFEELGINGEEAHVAAKEIIDYIGKIENLFRYFSTDTITDVRFQNRGILQRKIQNFDWNTYLVRFFNVLGLKIDQFNFDIRTKNLELLEKIVNFIDQSDQRILGNYLVWRYVKFGMKHDCEEFLPYFRPAVWLRLWKKYMNQDDEVRHLELLNNFEESYNEVKDERMKVPSLLILERVKSRKNVVANHTHILNEDIVKKHYDTFEVSPTALYLNQINFYHAIVRDYILFGENGKFSELYYSFLSGLGAEIDIFAHDKPMLYYFISENLELWRKAFNENKPWNSTTLQECTKYNIMDKDLIELAANIQNYKDYLEWSESNPVKYNENDSLINNNKLYFIALAQYQCFDTGHYKLHDGGIFKFLQYSPEFSTIFQCKEDDKMNSVANDCYMW